MGNIRQVVAFEVSRTLRKPSFWLATLAIPLLIGVIGTIAAFASIVSSSAAQEKAEETDFSFAYIDESGLIDSEIASEGMILANQQQCQEKAISGEIDACFSYPADLSASPIMITAQDVGLVANFKYETLARRLLEESIDKRLGDAALVSIVRNGVTTATITYRDSVQADGLGEVIAPLIFPLLFFLLIVLLGNLMLSAFLEEKENRVAEMILTTINARSLLVGKLVGIVLTGLVQISIFLVPSLVGLIIWSQQPIYGVALSFDTQRMILGALIFIGSFCLNMVSVVTVGMIMPTAKEASGLFTPILLATIMPLYAAGMMVTDPSSPIVEVLTYFPWSGGLTSLVRNAFGNLDLMQGLGVVIIQFAATLLVGLLASRIAQYGMISYTKALDLRTIWRRA